LKPSGITWVWGKIRYPQFLGAGSAPKNEQNLQEIPPSNSIHSPTPCGEFEFSSLRGFSLLHHGGDLGSMVAPMVVKVAKVAEMMDRPSSEAEPI